MAYSLTVYPPDAAQMQGCSARFCSCYESCLCALGMRKLPKILKMCGIARSRLALATRLPCCVQRRRATAAVHGRMVPISGGSMRPGCCSICSEKVSILCNQGAL